MDDTSVYVSGGVVASLIIIILVIFLIMGILTHSTLRPKREKKSSALNTQESISSSLNLGLKIFNYLKIPITVIYYDPEGRSSKVLSSFIPPESVIGIDKNELNLEKGGKMQFMSKQTEHSVPERIYKDYILLSGDLPQEVHIGMVTTKYLNFTSPVLFSGAYEMRHIMMHNRMEVPITINGYIKIPPGEFVKYSTEEGGVSVGVIFNNDEGYFPPVEIEIPITDLYFGAVDNKPLEVYQGQHYLWDEAIL